jgi:hypothetical protein
MLSEVRRAAAIQAIHELDHFKKVEWFSEVDSTNRYLARECKSGQLPIPSLIVTDRRAGVRDRVYPAALAVVLLTGLSSPWITRAVFG